MKAPTPMNPSRWFLLGLSSRPAILVFAFACLALSLKSNAADGPQIDAEVLKKVKAATVHFKVTLSDGRIAQGSGFFADEPGHIITNAHVLSMLDPESRKPTKIEVTIHSGTGNDKTLPATLLGLDRGSDLAVVRVEDKDLPAPLKFGSTKGLLETQSVFVFGFPFGQELGKEITVGKSSVSSLRKIGESIQSVQLDGGLNPGNSGGPVVDSAGNVIGVAVSGVRGTAIGNAIPAEIVNRFLNGRLVSTSTDVPYKDGDKVMLGVTYELIDPLCRLKQVEFQLWAGNPGAPRPPASKEPAPLPGDSEKVKYKMNYEKKLTVTLDVPLPKLGDKQVYWMQPIITNGLGETRWVTATTIPPKTVLDRRALTLKYLPPVNGKQTAEIITNGDFKIRNSDGEMNSIGMNITTGFTETFAAEAPKEFPLRLTYDRFGITILLNNKPLERDAEFRKSQTDIRFAAADVAMDKDGGFGTSKPDLKRVPKTSQDMIKDLSDQILQSHELLSIPYPEKKIDPMDTWKVQRSLLIGNAIVAVPVQADITYKYMGVQIRDGKEGALLRVEGRVKGRKGDSVDVAGTVNGTAFVSLETGQILFSVVTVKADVDLTFQKKQSKAVGTLSVSVKRPAPIPAPK